MLSRESIGSLLSYCQSEFGDDLRVVTLYGRDIHEYVYTRPDIREQFSQAERGRFRYPLMAMHDAAWQMFHHHTLIDEPDVVAVSYGDIRFLQLPLSETEGVLVSFDVESDLPEAFISKCQAILSDPSNSALTD